MVTKIEEPNYRIYEAGVSEVMVGSMDWEALYPSIHQREGGRIVVQ